MEVGNTLTYYNADRDDVPSNYGKVVPRIGFYARFPNPVESYFNHQAQKIMVNLAISAVVLLTVNMLERRDFLRGASRARRAKA